MAQLKTSVNKHSRILAAAVKVFAQKGFFHSRVADIAEKAGVADGTIYLYFENKDDILIKLFEEKMEQFIKRGRSELAGARSASAKIGRLITLHLELLGEDKELAQVITVELRQSAKFMHEYSNPKFLEYMNFITGLFKQAQKEGSLHPGIPPHLAARALFGAMDELALRWSLSEKDDSRLAASGKFLADLFSTGILSQSPAKPRAKGAKRAA